MNPTTNVSNTVTKLFGTLISCRPNILFGKSDVSKMNSYRMAISSDKDIPKKYVQ